LCHRHPLQANKDTHDEEAQALTQDLLDCFNQGLGTVLLYKSERAQYKRLLGKVRGLGWDGWAG
jgi:hypothetical protein